ncbi:MAG TPA: xanthine dehydrogenase family protein molybdopterin-binding subunit, partial [Enterovirga sp.]
MKFGVGQPVHRREDPILVRGEGRYTDDLAVPGQAYAVMVRSPIAHGIIRNLDSEAAKENLGVLGVYTGADLAGYGAFGNGMAFKNRDGSPMARPPRRALATDKVRYVGQPVAFVVATTAEAAREAAEAVGLDIESLDPAVTPEDAGREGAPLLYEEAPGNVLLDYHYGDTDAVTKAFAKAAHV